MSVDDKGILGRSLDGSIESALGGIILQQVSQIVGGNQIIDSDNFKFVAEKSLINKGAKDQTTDAAESINSNFSRHLRDICSYGKLERNEQSNGECPENGKALSEKLSIGTILFSKGTKLGPKVDGKKPSKKEEKRLS